MTHQEAIQGTYLCCITGILLSAHPLQAADSCDTAASRKAGICTVKKEAMSCAQQPPTTVIGR